MNANPAPANASSSGYDRGALFEQLLSQAEARSSTPVNIVSAEFRDAEIERCASDILYWVNTYCYTYDPRLLPSTPNIPFKLFPRQEEFLLWIQERERLQEGGLAEKCRDVGFTWLNVVYDVHAWLFRTGYTCGYGSRKEALVDRLGDMDSIFEKIRFAIARLPVWMQPKGYNPKVHAGFLKILNPANGASITGEGGDNIGRGGRKTRYTVDEHAYLARPKKVEAALSQNTNSIMRVSTPNGNGNEFWKIRFGGNIEVFTFCWMDDPRKNKFIVYDEAGDVIETGNGLPTTTRYAKLEYPWYAKQAKTLDRVTLAQEVDINYSASIEGVCIPDEWIKAAVNLPLPEIDLSAYPIIAGLDVAAGGKNKTVLIASQGPRVIHITAWSEANTTRNAWTVAAECERLRVSVLNIDGIGPGNGLISTYEASVQPLPFIPVPIIGGASCSESVWPGGKTSREMFINLRAELYWKLRARFEKAYEYRQYLAGAEDGAMHPAEEMISIPNHANLIAELSQPLAMRTNTGKIKIESKQDMAKRGVESPDHADALMYTQAQTVDFSDVGKVLGVTDEDLEAEYTSEAATIRW